MRKLFIFQLFPLGVAMQIICLHLTLSLASSSVTSTLCMSIFTTFMNFLCSLPLSLMCTFVSKEKFATDYKTLKKENNKSDGPTCLTCVSLSQDSGDVLWSYCRDTPFFSSPNCFSEHIVIGSVDGHICCFSNTGKLVRSSLFVIIFSSYYIYKTWFAEDLSDFGGFGFFFLVFFTLKSQPFITTTFKCTRMVKRGEGAWLFSESSV